MEVYRKVRLACRDGMSERAAARHFAVSHESVRKLLAFSAPPGSPHNRRDADPVGEVGRAAPRVRHSEFAAPSLAYLTAIILRVLELA